MQRKRYGQQEENLWKGVAAGLVAGFAASWTMNQVFTVWSKLNQNRQQPEQSAKKSENTDPATLKLARRISREVFHRDLPDDKMRIAEAAVHYGFGTVMGGIYGGLSDYVPRAQVAQGAAFGTLLFLVADETAVPLMGLSGKANEVPLSSHVLGFTAHLVYGVTTELVRKGARRLLAA